MKKVKAGILPDLSARAVAMREAGYTVAAISTELSISVRSLQRMFATHRVKKGAAHAQLLEEARTALVTKLTSNEELRIEAARLLVDNLGHAQRLRSRMCDAADLLVATNLHEAALLMRAAAAYSTALKNTADVLGKSLRIDKVFDGVSQNDLPELVVRELTTNEVTDLRVSQRQQDEDDADAIEKHAAR